MKKFSILVIFAFGVIIFGGYFLYYKRPTITPRANDTLEKIVVGNAGQLSILNLIAADRNYFKQNGLDVQIREHDSGASTVDALLAGEVDVAVSAEFVGVRKIFEGADLIIVTQVAKRRGDVYRLVARRDKGINSQKELISKRIGVTEKTVGSFYLERFLTFYDLRREDVILIDLPPSEVSEKILKGEIDAAVSFEPRAYSIEKSLGSNAISWSAQGDLHAFGLAYTTKSFAKENPGIIEKYVRALAQAEKYLIDKNKESRDFVERVLNYDESYMQYVWTKLDPGVNLDQELLIAMEAQARWLIRNELIEQTEIPNYLDYIHFPALERVKPEVITIVH